LRDLSRQANRPAGVCWAASCNNTVSISSNRMLCPRCRCLTRYYGIENTFPVLSVKERFIAIQKASSRGEDECWNWLGSKDIEGYGRFTISGITYKAHRMAIIYSGGELQDADCACHKCDNPSCVNPKHLFSGSVKDNVIDAVKKGRHGRMTHKK